MFRVFRILHRFDKIVVWPHTADILWRAGEATFDTDRVGLRRIGREYLLHEHGVLPAIAEVVFVGELGLLAARDLTERELLFVLHFQVIEVIRVRDAVVKAIAVFDDDKLVQV